MKANYNKKMSAAIQERYNIAEYEVEHEIKATRAESVPNDAMQKMYEEVLKNALKMYKDILSIDAPGTINAAYQVLGTLVSQKPLSCIEYNDEFVKYSENDRTEVFRCKRYPKLFKMRSMIDTKDDQEKYDERYTDVERITFYPNGGSVGYHNRVINDFFDALAPIEFPYSPSGDKISAFGTEKKNENCRVIAIDRYAKDGTEYALDKVFFKKESSDAQLAPCDSDTFVKLYKDITGEDYYSVGWRK